LTAARRKNLKKKKQRSMSAAEPSAAAEPAAAEPAAAVDAGAKAKKDKPKKEKEVDENTPCVNLNPEFFAHRVAVWDRIKAEQAAPGAKGVCFFASKL
jgi:hypothetical protein